MKFSEFWVKPPNKSTKEEGHGHRQNDIPDKIKKNGTFVAYELHQTIMLELESLASSLMILEEIRQPTLSVSDYGVPLKTQLGEIRLMTE